MKIAIISQDAIRLPLLPSTPKHKTENGSTFSMKDKCSRATALGQRAQHMAEVLAEEFDVTVLVPDLNYPGEEYIDGTLLNFKTISYNWFEANWKFSKNLNDILINFDVVIIQTTTGTGFKNVSYLPKDVIVIVDGWVPFLVEFPCALLSYEKEEVRKDYWNMCVPQYVELMTRANLILYANDAQGNFYDGLAISLNKLNYNTYQKLPTMKVPYGIEDRYPLNKKQTNGKTKLIWYGSIYPWYNPFILADAIKDMTSVTIDFVGVEHPRFKKLYKTQYREIFEEFGSINYITGYNDEPSEMLYEYDAGIIIAQDWLENKYSNRCRIFDMLSNGLPVIMNEGSPLFKEDILQPVLFKVSSTNPKADLERLCGSSNELHVTKEFFYTIYRELSWSKCLRPLINYIEEKNNA